MLTNFDDWARPKVDQERRSRLLLGYLVGLGVVSSTGAFIVLTSNQAKAVERDEVVLEAQLAREPEPPPEPEPEIAPKPKAEAPKPPPSPKVAVPKEVPKEPLKEAEANQAQLADDSDPFQRDAKLEESKPTASAEIVVTTPPPPRAAPKPEKKVPIRVTEEVTPPVAMAGNARPEYPAEARAAGIEGIVLVKYVVTESGSVADVKVFKGPPELANVCVAAVRSWRFTPALLEGKPVSVVRIARFPFKIRT